MPQTDFDVIVVGAGIGGLAAGTLMSQAGYKTLIVESKNRVGGRASTEEVEGFKLPLGGIAIHKGSDVDELFKRVGAPLDLVYVPRLFYRLGGKDYEMPPKGSISTMFDIVSKLDVKKSGRLTTALLKAGASEKIMGAFRKSIKEPEKERLTFKDWLLQYSDDENALDIFDCIATSLLGGRFFELPASAMFAWFVRMGGSRDVGIPPEGSVVNMNRLADVVRKNGDVWLNSPAKKVLVKGGAAYGVEVERNGKREEVTGKAVICDINPKWTIGMAGEDNFSEDYLRLARLRVRPQGTVVAYVASDIPLWPDDGAPAILMLTGTRRVVSMVPLSNACPKLAPPGQHLMFIAGPPVSSEYRLNEEEEIRQNMLDIEEQLPQFKKHGRVIRIVSKNMDDEFPFQGTRVGFGMPLETPVKNLYNTGDWCLGQGLTGTTSAVEASFRLVDMLKKRMK